VTAFGTYVFRMTVVSGTCVPRADDVQITFNQPATANSGVGFTTCVNSAVLAPIPLSGTIGGGSTPATGGRWERVTGTGTIQSSGAATGSVINNLTVADSYVPSAADFTAGSVQVRLVAIDPDGVGGPCGNVNGTTITITLDRLPTNVNPDSDNNVANNRTCTSSFVLGASTPTNGTGTWTGPVGITFSNANSPTSTVNNLPLTGGLPTVTTLTWTVRSALNVCAPIVTTVDITRNPLPAVADPVPVLCDLGAGSVTGVNLTTFHDGITGIVGSVDRTLQWFSNPGRTVAVPDPTNVTVTNGLKFYNIVTTTSTTCASNGEITFTVRPLPTRVNQTAQICEDSPPGSSIASGINLQNFETAIAGGSMVNRNIEWYEDAALTILVPPGASPGDEQNYNINGDITLHAKIIDTASPTTPQCFSQATLTLDYQSRPSNNQMKDASSNILVDGLVGVPPFTATRTFCATDALLLLQIDPSINPGATYSWNIPPVSYPGEFEILSAAPYTGIFIIVKFPNPTSLPASNYNGGLPITVTETLGSGCTGNPLTLIVNVDASPPTPVISGPSEVCQNGLATYTITSGAGVSHTWNIPPGATITNSPTGSSINVQMGLVGGSVSVVASSGASCLSSPSNAIPVNINPRPAFTFTMNPICSGSNVSSQLTLTPSIAAPFNSADVRFNWEVLSSNVVGANIGDSDNGVTTINQILTNTTGLSGTVIYRVTPVGPASTFCTGVAQNITVTVNPQPIILPNQAKAICSGQPVSKEILLNPAGLPLSVFNWPDPDGAGPATSGTNVLSGAAGTIHINDILINPTSSPIIVNYVVTPTSANNCVGPAEVIAITVNPTPFIPAQVLSTCSGVGFAVAPVDGVGGGIVPAGTTYRWTAPSVTGGITGGSAQPILQPTISQTLTNPTNVPQTATYTVTPVSGASGSCVGPNFTVTVTVDPTPVIPAQSATICSGDIFTVSPSNGGATIVPAGTTYTWLAPAVTGGITGGSASVGPQANISQTLTNPTNVVQTATYTVTPTSGASGACVGTNFTVTVTVNPRPSIQPQIASTCSGSAFTVAPVNSGTDIVPGGTTYAWGLPTFAPGAISGASAQSGQPNISQTLTNLTNTDQVVTYSVTATSGLCSSTPFSVTVTVNPRPVIPAQTISTCSGSGFTVSPANNAPVTIVPVGTTYEWNTPVFIPGTISGASAQSGQADISQTLTNLTNTNQLVTYTVTPRSGTCTGSNFTVTVTVNPTPVIPAQTATICGGETFTVIPSNGGATIVPAGTTYTWSAPAVTGGITGGSASAGPQANISQTLTNPTSIVQIATYTVTPTSGASGACGGLDFTVTVTVNPTPFIPAQVLSTCSGTAFTVAPVDGVGGGIVPAGTTYRWTAPVVTGGITGGSAQPILQPTISQTLTNPTNVPQTATYTVTPVSGASGSCVGPNFTVTVTVDPTPVIPAQSATICSGDIFTVSPSNGGATIVPAGTTYTWLAPAVTGGITGGSASVGPQANISQTLTNPTNVVQTATYTVTPTSGASGACVGTNFTVTVTVNPRPSIQPQIASTCSGSAFTVAPVNSGTDIVPGGTTYAWGLPTFAPGAISGASAQSGQPNISQTLTNLTNTDQVVTYSVTATSGLCSSTPFSVTVTVNPRPVIPAQTISTCSGSGFTVSPANNAPVTIVPVGTTYEWNTPVFIPGTISGASAQSGQADISQTLTNLTNTNQLVTYTVTPRSGTCTGSNFTVTVTVNPTPVIPAQTATICGGETFTVIPSNGGATIVPAGTTYTWLAPAVTGGITGGSASVGPQANISQTLTNPTSIVQIATYTVTPTSGASGACGGLDFTVTVTVNPTPFIPAQVLSTCSGTAFTVAPVDGVGGGIVPAGTTYRWTAPVVTGGITGGSAQPILQPTISQTLTNPTNVPQTATYTVTPVSGASGSCVGPNFTVTVTVDPTPVIPAQSATICSGDIFTVSPSNGGATIVPAGTTYTWLAPAVTGGITGGSASVGPQANISQTLTNPTNVVQTATYTVTPTSGASGACVGTNFTVTVTVNPRPSIQPQIASTCSGSAFTVAPVNSGTDIVPGGTTYAWGLPTFAPGAISGASAQSGQPNISQTLTNLTNTDQVVTYSVTATSGLCSSTPFSVTVTVNPRPVIPAQTISTCSGSGFTVSPANNAPVTIVPVGTTYEWNTPVFIPGTISGASAQSGQADISQTLTNLTNTNQLVTYTVTPRSGTCTGSNFTVTVTVNPTPVIPAQTATICGGETFTVIPSNGGATIVPAGTTYTWLAPAVTGGITGGSASVGPQANISQTLTNPTSIVQIATYTVTPTSGASGACGGLDFTVTVTVNPTPFIPAQVLSTCSGTAFTVAPVDGVGGGIVPAGTTYRWTAPVVTGGITGGSAQPILQPTISQTLTNPTNVPQTATYTVTPVSGASGSCVGPNFTVTVTVDPTPVIPAQSATICSGDIFTVSPSNGGATIVPAGTTYTWLAPAVTGGITGGSASVGPQANISQTLTNPTNVVQTATYTVTPTSGASGACVGTNFTVTVTVNPRPVIPDQIATACSKEAFNINPINGGSVIVPTGTTYEWLTPMVTGGMTGGSASAGPQPTISQALTNLTGVVQTATYSVTPRSGASGLCVGSPPFTVTITVNPEPVAQAVSTIERCSSQPINFDIQDIINNAGSFAGGNSVDSRFTYTVVVLPADGSGLDLTPNVVPGLFDRTTPDDLPIGETFTNTTNHDVTLTYTITPRSVIGNCPGTPFTLKVIYHPEPVGSNLSDPNCNTALNHDIQTQITNGIQSVFTYTISQVPIGALGPLPSDRTTASDAPITDTFINLTGSPVVVTYTIQAFRDVPAPNNCAASNTFTYAVTISPRPVGIPDTKAAQCSGEAFSIDPQSNISPAVASTFTWRVSYDGGALGPITSGNITAAANQFVNTSNVIKDAVYTVTPTATGSGCSGDPFTITVPILPEPVMDPLLANPPAICSTNSLSTNGTNVILGTNGLSIGATDFVVVLKNQEAGLIGTPTVGTFPAIAGFSSAIANDTYSNTTAAQLRVVYTVTPKNGACFGEPMDITVLVNPEPVLADPGFPSVCSSNVQNASPINVILGTDVGSVNPDNYQLIQVEYSTGGPFSPTVPAGVTPDGSNTGIGLTSGINLIKNDKYTNITAGPVTVRYTVQASKASCLSEEYFFTIIINPEPTMIPASANQCSDELSGLIVGPAAGSVLTTHFELQNIIRDPALIAGPINAAIGTTYPANLAGGQSDFLANDIFTNTSNSPRLVTYRVAPIANGCKAPAVDIQFTVNPAPAVENNLNRTVCSDDVSGILFATEVSPLSVAASSYAVQTITISPGLIRTAGNAAFPRVGVTANDIQFDRFINPTNDTLSVIYGVRAESGAGCTGPIRNIRLVIEPTIIATPLNSTPLICSNDLTNIELQSPTNPSSGNITFNYTAVSSVGNLVTGFVPALNSLPEGYIISDALINNDNAPATVTYTITPRANGAKGGAGCSGNPVVVVVTVEPKPKLVASPLIQTRCEGVATNITLNSATVPSVGTTEFQLLSAVATGGLTGMSADNTIFTPGSTLADVLNNPTTTVQTVTYTFRPQIAGGLGCLGDNVVVTVSVDPLPTITPSAQADVCSGGLVDITLTPDVANTVAFWTVSAPVGIAGASNGAGNLIFQTLFNTTGNPLTVTYTVTPRANGCNGPALIIPIVVHPRPVLTLPPPPINVCHGTNINIPLVSNVAGTTFTWTVDDPSDILTPAQESGSGTAINYPITNTTGFQASLIYSITPIAPGPAPANQCTGDPKILIVTVAPQITATLVNADNNLCAGTREFLIFEFVGQAPFSFTYSDGTTNFNETNAGNFKVIPVTPAATTTYTLGTVTDALGCSFTPVGEAVTLTVGDTDANFSVLGPTSSCGPYTATFQYNEIAGVTYKWQWFDGSVDTEFTAVASNPAQTITHTFDNLNPNGSANYRVTLSTTRVGYFAGECFKTQSRTITIFPTIITSVSANRNNICSGEPVQFFNQSFGVTTHRWFYRIQGTTAEIDVRNTPTVNYSIANTSANNPEIYEVVYQPSNGLCPTPEVVTPITVYRDIVAGFDEGTVPPFIGGNATVNFTNTSTPVDATQFRYEWNFGLNATPATANGAGPFSVNYSTPGPRDISLRVVNIAAETAGLGCESTFSKTINIQLLPLVAAFEANPLRACFPADIEVTENTSTGDLMEWRVVDSNGRIAATSNAPLPIFLITSPGVYSVFLTTRNSITGQVANTQRDNFEIFDNPVASFDLRPNVVFVPDTEMTTFNFSTGATDYAWDFGDGGTSDDVEPVYKYRVEGVYDVQLVAINDHGAGLLCTDTLTRQVTAKQGGVTKVPNAFTPNPGGPGAGSGGGGGTGGNGSFNDVFLPIVKGAEEFNMQIFDRWGNLIFESNSSNIGWDGYDKNGRILPAGVYVYKLTIRLSDGQRSTQIGDVTMIR
jgi:gliding motility-associated-like protein